VTTPPYTATIRQQINRNVAKVVGGNLSLLEGSDFEVMGTQYEPPIGRTIGERAVSALKLGGDPEFVKLFASKSPATDGMIANEWCGRYLALAWWMSAIPIRSEPTLKGL
jgi:hypothetical protein